MRIYINSFLWAYALLFFTSSPNCYAHIAYRPVIFTYVQLVGNDVEKLPWHGKTVCSVVC